jgi:hypothetical protein
MAPKCYSSEHRWVFLYSALCLGTPTLKFLLLFVLLPLGALAQNLFISSTGETGTSGTNWSITGTTLTVTGGDANIQAAVIVNALASGNLSVEATNITVIDDIMSTTANALTLKASNDIRLGATHIVSTDGGDITFWTDSDNDDVGRTYINQYENSSPPTTVESHGGNIVFGGGSDPSADEAVGDNGIYIRQASIDAGTGNVSIRGRGTRTSSMFGIGVTISESDVNGADIQIIGEGSNNPSFGNNWGISVESNSTLSATGAIDIQGQGGQSNAGGSNHGVWVANSTIETTGAGALGITGTGGTSNSSHNIGVTIVSAAVEATAGGTLSITGNGGSGTEQNDGIVLQNTATVRSSSGTTTLIAESGSGNFSEGLVVSSGGTNTIGDAGQSGDIIIRSDWPLFINTSTNSVLGTGSLTFEPLNDDFDVDISYPLANVNIASTFTGLTIGKASSADGTSDRNVTIAGETTIAGPITVYGGNIATNQNLTSTASNAEILLKSSGNIIQAANVDVTTNGGDVIFWSDSDSNNAGGVIINNNATIDTRTLTDRTNTTHTTGGGDIIIAGGLDDGGIASGTDLLVSGLVSDDGSPDGYAINIDSNYINWISTGLVLGTPSGSVGQDANINIFSGGGNIQINGKTTGANIGGNGSTGIIAYQGINMNAGDSGNLNILGVANVSSQLYTAGIDLAAWRIDTDSSVFQTKDGDLKIIGIGTGGSGDNQAIDAKNYDNDTRTTLAATGSGSVTLEAKGGDLNIGSTDILAASGAINIAVENSNNNFDRLSFSYWPPTSFGSYFGQKAGSLVTASSSNINITADEIRVDTGVNDAPTFDSTGVLTIKSYGDDFDTTLDMSNFILGNSPNGLTIGNSLTSADGTSDADVLISSATSIAGPITIYGADIAINQALTATTNTISLISSGNVTQTAALTANNLSLAGTGTFTLQNSTNNVATLAGGESGTRLGSLAYRDADALEIGTVGALNGLFTTGTLLVETENGNLTLSQALNATSTSDDAIILNAGRSESEGTATGGDIIVSGSPTITIDAAARAKLFSGSEANSTGLTTLVGGSSNTLFNFDETSDLSGEGLADNNAYAIYREVGTLSTESVVSGLETISFYPSPASTNLHIHNPSQIALKQISIFDLQGKLVMDLSIEQSIFNPSINVSRLDAAVYIIKIQTQDARQTTLRFTKE